MIKLLFVILLLLIYYASHFKETINTSIKQNETKEKSIIEQTTTIDKITENSEYIDRLKPSKVTQENAQERQKYTASWSSRKSYQEKFNNKYYDHKHIYPIYIELDKSGNRRVVSIPYQPRFYWSVKSGKTLKNFQKDHIERIMNGKRLLTLSTIEKAGTTLYTGVWISEHVFAREVEKLKKLGIYPPQLKNNIPVNHTFQNKVKKEDKIEEVMLTISTGNSKDSDTRNLVYMSINGERERYLLDLPNHKDRALGSINHYQIKLNHPVAHINSIRLSIEGFDAWKMKNFSVQLKSGKAYLKRHSAYVNRWFSQEEHDKKKLHAKASYTYYIEE